MKPGVLLAGTPYRVNRHLATGGMGSVYEVEDTSVGRLYVLKTLHPELVDRQDLALRMRDEARALGRLDHPHIVQVITAGVTSDAARTPFYVMERLVGQNLRAVLESRGALGRAHAYRIAIDILDALQHAHDRGMIHRDVKPENIFLHRGPQGTQTKLLDFGIVRMLDKHASLTHGKFIGTLRYASPEQVTGRPLAPASDLYSAALVIYEMLRGKGPFDDAGDALKIGAAHASTTAPSLGSLVSPDVDAALSQALAKDPTARQKSCGTLAATMRKALRDEEAKPNAATEVDLLTVQHPIEGDEEAPSTVAEAVLSCRETETAMPSTRLPSTRPEVPAYGPISATLAAPMPVAPPPPVIVNDAPRTVAVDRNAPTRITPPEPPRMPQNNTSPDMPLVIVAATPVPAPPNRNEITVRRPALDVAAPPARAVRTSDRTAIAAVFVAAALAVMMILGAVLVVRRPWDAIRNRSVGVDVGAPSAR